MWFSAYKFYACSLRFTSKYFNFLRGYKQYWKFNFNKLWVHWKYINTINFYTFISYPVALLNSLNNSRIFFFLEILWDNLSRPSYYLHIWQFNFFLSNMYVFSVLYWLCSLDLPVLFWYTVLRVSTLALFLTIREIIQCFSIKYVSYRHLIFNKLIFLLIPLITTLIIHGRQKCLISIFFF